MYVMSSYDLTEEKANEVRAALEKKKGVEEEVAISPVVLVLVFGCY